MAALLMHEEPVMPHETWDFEDWNMAQWADAPSRGQRGRMRRWILLVAVFLLRTPPLSAEVQECTITRADKLLCPSTTLASRQPFTGRVLTVLDASTLDIDRQGTRVRVHFFPVAGAAPEDVAALAGHQEVTVFLQEIDHHGELLGKIVLPNGQNLRQILVDRQQQRLPGGATPRPVPARWTPEPDAVYWTVEGAGQIDAMVWHNDARDKARWDFGNCFKTFQEAAQARQQIQEILRQLHPDGPGATRKRE